MPDAPRRAHRTKHEAVSATAFGSAEIAQMPLTAGLRPHGLRETAAAPGWGHAGHETHELTTPAVRADSGSIGVDQQFHLLVAFATLKSIEGHLPLPVDFLVNDARLRSAPL